MNPHPFDPQKITRYTVIRVHYEYQGQPAGEKLFVVLRQEIADQQAFCWCIKATSQIHRFTNEMLNGCIRYQANELPFFAKETLIDTSNILPLLHETLKREAALGRYQIEGKMPDDFHGKFIAAVRASTTLEPKKKVRLLSAVGEFL